MRSSLLLPIVFLFLAACNTTERVVHFGNELSPGAQMSANDIAALQTMYANADGVYLAYNETLEHNVSIAFTSTIPHWEFYHIVDRSYAVFNTASSELSEFRLEVPERDKLEQAALTIQRPGTAGITYSKEDLTVQTGSNGEKIYTMPYTISEPGTVIYEKFEITRGDLERYPPVSHDIPLQYDLPARTVNFRYVYPIWWQVDVKNLSLNQPLGFQRIEDSERRKIILTYESSDVPAFVEEPGGPYFKQRAPYFQLQVTNLSMGSALRYRAPEDWTEFAKDYREFAVSNDARTARSIQRTASNLVGPVSSDLEKVEIILNYIKDNIIVVEDSKQRSFDLVLSRREGNPYMITGLMQAMLVEAGIDSEFLLIHPAYEGYFDPDFYSEDQLEEPALGVLIEGEQYYVLPGRQRSLSEELPRYFAGQTAMVITEEGFGGFTEVFSGQVSGSNAIAIADNSHSGSMTPVSQNGNSTGTPSNTRPVVEPEVTTVPPVTQPQPQPDTSTSSTTQSGNTTPANTVPSTGTPGITSPITSGGNTQPAETTTNPPVQEEMPVMETEPGVPEWEGSINTGLGGFSWVVASKTSVEEARELAEEYAALYRAGISVDILRGESQGVVRYRIAIGQYSSRQLAEEDRSIRLSTVLPSDAWLLAIEPTM